MPCRWFPYQTIDPRTGLVFTESGAWEYIVENLLGNVRIKSIQLKKPPNETGYVFFLDGGTGNKLIYTKLQLGAGVVYGRSFHSSIYG